LGKKDVVKKDDPVHADNGQFFLPAQLLFCFA